MGQYFLIAIEDTQKKVVELLQNINLLHKNFLN